MVNLSSNVLQYTSSLQELVQDNQDGLQEQERKVNASHPRIISQYTHADKEEKARLQVSRIGSLGAIKEGLSLIIPWVH